MIFSAPGFGFFLIVYLCCIGIFALIGKAFDIPWFIFVGMVLAFLIFVLADIFVPELIYEACPSCGELKVEEKQYCPACGYDLIDDCICGHVWKDDQIYCPDCGKPRG